MDGKTVFVTGATGFVGGALCQRLLAEGARVHGLARNPEKGQALAATGVEVVEGDITNHPRMAEVVVGADVVMHVAAHLGPGTKQQYRAGNVDATRNLAQASAEAGVGRFVYTSSIAALGFIGDDRVDETKPLREYGDRYGDTKVAAERALHEVERETGLEIAIARLGMVYGPRSRSWAVRMFNFVRSGLLPLIGGEQALAYPVYIDNLLDGLLLCATHPAAAGQTFLFVDDPTTWAEYLGSFRVMLGKPRRIWRVPRWPVMLAVTLLDPFVRRRNLRYLADMFGGRGVVSNQKAKDVLGWQPRISLEEGMRRTEAWLREAGYL